MNSTTPTAPAAIDAVHISGMDDLRDCMLTRDKAREPRLRRPTWTFPRSADPLFWCYFIMVHGEMAYASVYAKNAVFERQTKLQCVEQLRSAADRAKAIARAHKFGPLAAIETNLAFEPRLSKPALLTLCGLHGGIRVLVATRTSYYELAATGTPPGSGGIEPPATFVIRATHHDDGGGSSGAEPQYELSDDSDADYIRRTLHLQAAVDKPLHPVSAYTLAELRDLTEALHLPPDAAPTPGPTSKAPTKAYLYARLVQYLSSAADNS